MEIILKKPTEILSSPRNDGGTAVAAAKTVDGGVAFVRWDPADKSWVIDNDLTAGDVLTLPPLPTSLMIALEVPSPNTTSAINLEKNIIEGAKLADQLELTKLKLRFIKERKKLTPDQLSKYKISDMEKRVDEEIQKLEQKISPKK